MGVEPTWALGPRDFKATGKRQRTKDLANSLPFSRPYGPRSTVESEGYGHPDGHLFCAGGPHATKKAGTMRAGRGPSRAWSGARGEVATLGTPASSTTSHERVAPGTISPPSPAPCGVTSVFADHHQATVRGWRPSADGEDSAGPGCERAQGVAAPRVGAPWSSRRGPRRRHTRRPVGETTIDDSDGTPAPSRAGGVSEIGVFVPRWPGRVPQPATAMPLAARRVDGSFGERESRLVHGGPSEPARTATVSGRVIEFPTVYRPALHEGLRPSTGAQPRPSHSRQRHRAGHRLRSTSILRDLLWA